MTGVQWARDDTTPADDPLMSVETVCIDEHRAYLEVNGELDSATGPALSAVLRSHLAAGRRFLRLDVSGLVFADAAGLATVTQAHHEALTRRGTLVLTGVVPRVGRMLALTGLDTVLFISGPR